MYEEGGERTRAPGAGGRLNDLFLFLRLLSILRGSGLDPSKKGVGLGARHLLGRHDAGRRDFFGLNGVVFRFEDLLVVGLLGEAVGGRLALRRGDDFCLDFSLFLLLAVLEGLFPLCLDLGPVLVELGEALFARLAARRLECRRGGVISPPVGKGRHSVSCRCEAVARGSTRQGERKGRGWCGAASP